MTTFQETIEKGTTPCKAGTAWECQACGKRSRTKYGFDSEGKRCSDEGYDESCMLNAKLIARVQGHTNVVPHRHKEGFE